MLRLFSCALAIKAPVESDKTATVVLLYEQAEKLFKVRLKLTYRAKSWIVRNQFAITMELLDSHP